MPGIAFRIGSAWKSICLALSLLLLYTAGSAQTDSTLNGEGYKKYPDSADKRDVIDVVLKLFKKTGFKRSKLEPGNASFIILPGVYYSPTLGFSGTLNANIGYYPSDYRLQNLSTIYSYALYSQHQQKMISVSSNIWTKKNNFVFQGVDWYFDYSEYTYGLGSKTPDVRQDLLRYKYLRIYESVLKQIFPDVYIGAGYKLDNHYDIKETGNKDGTVSDFKRYGMPERTISSGPSIDFLFDDRRNQINPKRGSFVNIVYSPKLTFLGSDNNWQLLKVDLRKYIKTSPNSSNVLAFWSLSYFTFGDMPPYLDLPAAGWDEQQKSGRGYVQGRYRGKNLLYFESEYRFKITHNGVLGGVVFGNAESFSEWNSNHFENLLPAAGAGIRLKLNKYTRTNLCIDYAVGAHGSSGIFVNIGEIF